MSEVQDKIKQIIVDELGVDAAEVTENARFMDVLGADSLDLVELVMRFDEDFDIEIADEAADKIQGVRDAYGMGAVQNIGIIPEHRGRSLGSYLVRLALDGFKQEGLRRASLEVTAQNTGAMRLYHRLGFRKTKTVYKAAEVGYV